jgi:UDP-N-acetylmuramoyl-L-alanyl-D-glutamate--2,6-diaminopimelate ligase
MTPAGAAALAPTRPAARTVAALVDGTPSVAATNHGDGSVVVSGMAIDSRAVLAGDLFCCLRGERVDGHMYAADAVAAGSVALLVDHRLGLAATEVVVPETRAAVGPLAATLWGHPSQAMSVVGITGTNGKTTTAHLLASILERAGRPTGVLGTLTGSFTTPEAPELQARLAALVQDGRRAVAMEVSSHALAMDRVAGTRFAFAVFTNLGRDHLDFHGTMERYFAAKAKLFTPGLSDHGVVNVDDPRGRHLVDVGAIPMTSYSMDDVRDLDVGVTSSRFTWRGRSIGLPVGGRFNVSNALAAATTATVLGVDEPTIAAGLSAAPPVPGRMEAVDAGQPFRVVVDFAHTPDALEGLLGELRSAVDGRLIIVFGCGGDRDRTKRPLMGRVASDGADLVVVTSDNPRSEPPEAIIGEVVAGIPPARRANLVTEPDRRAAIGLALDAARPGDAVVIAGKGHETTQTVAGESRPFDDREAARQLLEAGR